MFTMKGETMPSYTAPRGIITLSDEAYTAMAEGGLFCLPQQWAFSRVQAHYRQADRLMRAEGITKSDARRMRPYLAPMHSCDGEPDLIGSVCQAIARIQSVPRWRRRWWRIKDRLLLREV